MPELVSNQHHDKGGRLKFVLNLVRAERPEAWEGWLQYEISLMAGDDTLAIGTQRTIMANEITQLCEILSESTTGEFEPVEPDFQLTIRPSETGDQSERCEVFVFMNEAVRRGEGYYSRDGFGLRLPLDRSACHKFATQLNEHLNQLTAELPKG